jgi:glutamine amidotransferase
MDKKKVGIIDYGAGNLFAIFNACLNIDFKPQIISSTKQNFDEFSILILPGVGSFETAMKSILDLGFYEKIVNFKKSGKLLLGICLGMQLLTTKSYEGKETSGFNFVQSTVTSVSDDLKNIYFTPRVPITGWNSVYFNKRKENLFLDFNSTDFYFIHSFWIRDVNEKYIIGNSYFMNNKYCAFFKQENVIGIQFHPERSRKKGISFLKKILDLKC